MKTDFVDFGKNQSMMMPPLARPVSASESFVRSAKLFFATLALAIFLGLMGAGIWYFWVLFKNDSYKLVASFLLLIAATSAICRYGLWYSRKYGGPVEG